MSKISLKTAALPHPPPEVLPTWVGLPSGGAALGAVAPGEIAPMQPEHRHRPPCSAAWRADKQFRRMRAALNASEGSWFDRIFAGWRVRWRVHRLRVRLRQLGAHSDDLPPPRKAFVQKKVPIAITDVAWHEQLRLWWWPPGISPDIDA